MTIHEALKYAADTSGVMLIYANLDEANFTVDSLVSAGIPVCLIIPFDVVDTPGKSGVLKSTFPFDAFFLTKIPNITTDYQAYPVEQQAIEPMRAKARQFLYVLNQTPIIDPEGDGIGTRTHVPTYSSFDANLFGVHTTATIPVIEGLTGCGH